MSGPMRSLDSTIISDRFTIGTNQISSLLQDKDWVGTHTIQLKSFNGVQNPNSELGDEGVFGSEVSNDISFTVIDTCL